MSQSEKTVDRRPLREKLITVVMRARCAAVTKHQRPISSEELVDTVLAFIKAEGERLKAETTRESDRCSPTPS